MILPYLLLATAGCLIEASDINKTYRDGGSVHHVASSDHLKAYNDVRNIAGQRYHQLPPTLLWNSLKLLLVVFLIYLTVCSIYQNDSYDSRDDDDDY